MNPKMDPILKRAGKISKKNNSFLVYKYLFPAVEKSIKQFARGKVIDIGCGNKPYHRYFSESPAVNSYFGCDTSQNEAGTVDLVCDACKIPVDDNSFDTVFSTQLVEHIADTDSLMTEMTRILVPGGTLILSGPQYWPVHGIPNDYFRFTRYGFEKICKTAGLKVILISENGGAWATAGQALSHAFEFSTKKSIFFRLARFFFYRLGMIRLSNGIFLWMDKKDHQVINPINYVIVAEKPL